MKTVLVVDDDGMFVKNVSEVLADGGFRVLRAADGAEALGILEREHTLR
jgi:CheY-like chemotaxis protein